MSNDFKFAPIIGTPYEKFAAGVTKDDSAVVEIMKLSGWHAQQQPYVSVDSSPKVVPAYFSAGHGAAPGVKIGRYILPSIEGVIVALIFWTFVSGDGISLPYLHRSHYALHWNTWAGIGCAIAAFSCGSGYLPYLYCLPCLVWGCRSVGVCFYCRRPIPSSLLVWR